MAAPGSWTAWNGSTMATATVDPMPGIAPRTMPKTVPRRSVNNPSTVSRCSAPPGRLSITRAPSKPMGERRCWEWHLQEVIEEADDRAGNRDRVEAQQHG
jgi:hypothetical protein